MPKTVQEMLWSHIDGIASALDELHDAGFVFRFQDEKWYWENRSAHRIGTIGYHTLGMAIRDAFAECYILPFQS